MQSTVLTALSTSKNLPELPEGLLSAGGGSGNGINNNDRGGGGGDDEDDGLLAVIETIEVDKLYYELGDDEW